MAISDAVLKLSCRCWLLNSAFYWIIRLCKLMQSVVVSVGATIKQRIFAIAWILATKDHRGPVLSRLTEARCNMMQYYEPFWKACHLRHQQDHALRPLTLHSKSQMPHLPTSFVLQSCFSRPADTLSAWIWITIPRYLPYQDVTSQSPSYI